MPFALKDRSGTESHHVSALLETGMGVNAWFALTEQVGMEVFVYVLVKGGGINKMAPVTARQDTYGMKDLLSASQILGLRLTKIVSWMSFRPDLSYRMANVNV